MRRNKILLLCVGIVVFFSSMAWGENIKQTKNDKTIYVYKMGTIAPEHLGVGFFNKRYG